MTIRSLYHVTLTVTLFLTVPILAQAQAARPVNPLATYAERYATINRELPRYRTIAVDMDAVGIERRSTDGGRLEVSCKGSETRRIVATDYGEHGSTVTNFYFWNNSLFFVQILSHRADELYGPAVESSDGRLYYLNGRLVQWLDEKNVQQSINTRAARETDRFVRRDATAFLSRLNGCPIGVLAAADQDTAAPMMAPAPAAYDTGMKTRAPLSGSYDTGMKADPNVRERAYIATMKIDLRNLATYEEQFAADNRGLYFAGQASLVSPLHGFSPSRFVAITVTATRGSRPNWSATAIHAKSSAMCVLHGGVINCE